MDGRWQDPPRWPESPENCGHIFRNAQCQCTLLPPHCIEIDGRTRHRWIETTRVSIVRRRGCIHNVNVSWYSHLQHSRVDPMWFFPVLGHRRASRRQAAPYRPAQGHVTCRTPHRLASRKRDLGPTGRCRSRAHASSKCPHQSTNLGRNRRLRMRPSQIRPPPAASRVLQPSAPSLTPLPEPAVCGGRCAHTARGLLEKSIRCRVAF